MGIRINKAIGWALPCAQDPLDRETGLSVQPLAVHGEWLMARAAAARDEDLRSELEYNAAALLKVGAVRVGDCAVWTAALGNGTLIVLPPGYADTWHRVDDDLDFAFDDGQENRIHYTTRGFHPFGGQWMDERSGERLNGHAAPLMRDLHHGTYDTRLDRLDGLARLVRPVGTEAPGPYTDFADASRRIVPWVPDQVRWVAEHLNLFPDPADVLKLRPARATWWA